MAVIPAHTVTYCQYGARAMKPTDIFTNASDPRFCPPCRNGAPCHESAPRGSKSGTQGLANARERGASPERCACTSLTCASARCPSERRRAMPVKKRGSSAARRLHRRRRAAFSSARDDWETPAWLLSALDSEFHFTLDAASSRRQRQMRKAPHQTRRRAAADWGGERCG